MYHLHGWASVIRPGVCGQDTQQSRAPRALCAGTSVLDFAEVRPVSRPPLQAGNACRHFVPSTTGWCGLNQLRPDVCGQECRPSTAPRASWSCAGTLASPGSGTNTVRRPKEPAVACASRVNRCEQTRRLWARYPAKQLPCERSLCNALTEHSWHEHVGLCVRPLPRSSGSAQEGALQRYG